MVLVKLAFRNVFSRGLRTWLNVFVLSLSFVVIVWAQGLIKGMTEHAMNDMIDMEYGGGQFWHRLYDPYDPLTMDESRGPLPASLAELVDRGRATPILIAPGTIFPKGRAQSVLLKGIDPGQKIIGLPSGDLVIADTIVIPGLIGERMARQSGLKVGDYVTARWRDSDGVFDAGDILIVQIMRTTVQSVDNGQIWIPLEKLREMLRAPGEATLVVLQKGTETVPPGDENWIYRDLNYLLQDIKRVEKSKSAGLSIFYFLLLSMALLAIFDTQVLAIFRRQKEIGTLMALGMPRVQVIGLFTIEGAIHGVMALIAGALYGIPLLIYTAKRGIPLPEAIDSVGIAISSTLYPSYGSLLLLGTTLLVLATVTLVSFLPARKIAKLKPTDALRGKLS